MSAGPFQELERDLQEQVGFTLFTILQWLPERQALRRVHSSRPVEYPVGGEKAFAIWPEWLTSCVTDQRSYLGPDRDAVRAAFYDHELIDSLGCGAFINTPLIDDGRTTAILCLLGPEHCYEQDHVRRTDAIAAGLSQTVKNWKGIVT